MQIPTFKRAFDVQSIHRRSAVLAATLAAVSIVATLAGCEERINQPTAQSQAQAAKSQPVLGGGGSGTGKAVNNARSLEQQVELHNAEIEKAADGVNKN